MDVQISGGRCGDMELESLEGEETSMGGRGKHGGGVSTGAGAWGRSREAYAQAASHWEGVLIPYLCSLGPYLCASAQGGVFFFFFFSQKIFDLDHFKSLCVLVTILLLFMFGVFGHGARGAHAAQPETEPPPCVGRRSPNHWIARKSWGCLLLTSQRSWKD